MPPAPSAERISYGPRRVPAATLTSSTPPAGSGSFRIPHPPQEVVVARVVSNAVEARIHVDPHQPGRMILVGLVEPLKCGTLGSETHVDDCEVKRRYVLSCRSPLQLS